MWVFEFYATGLPYLINTYSQRLTNIKENRSTYCRLSAICANHVCGSDRLAILERNIHEIAIIGVFVHIHYFVRAEDRDSDFF